MSSVNCFSNGGQKRQNSRITIKHFAYFSTRPKVWHQKYLFIRNLTFITKPSMDKTYFPLIFAKGISDRDLKSSVIDQNTAITTAPSPCTHMPEGVWQGQNKISQVLQSQSKTDLGKQVITMSRLVPSRAYVYLWWHSGCKYLGIFTKKINCPKCWIKTRKTLNNARISTDPDGQENC